MNNQSRLSLLLILISFTVFAQDTFTNPILQSGADPYSTFHGGNYYYTNTLVNKLVLWKTKNLANINGRFIILSN